MIKLFEIKMRNCFRESSQEEDTMPASDPRGVYTGAAASRSHPILVLNASARVLASLDPIAKDVSIKDKL